MTAQPQLVLSLVSSGDRLAQFFEVPLKILANLLFWYNFNDHASRNQTTAPRYKLLVVIESILTMVDDS